MLRTRWISRRKALRAKGLRMVTILLAITLGTGGCLVTASRYEDKSREADSLRDALASTNRENSTLKEEYVSVRKQLDEATKANESLSLRTREQEEQLQKVQDELTSATRSYEGTRITREELISQLLEREKATGKRIQKLRTMAQVCDMEREKLREENAVQGAAIAGLEKRVAELPDAESLRRERDMLLGRIERIREERVRETKRRDIRFTELAKTFFGISSQIETVPAGPAMRIRVPDMILFRKGKTTLTDAGERVIREVGKAVSEFPDASIIITSGGKSKAEAIRSLLTNHHALPEGKVLANAGNGDGKTKLLLVIP